MKNRFRNLDRSCSLPHVVGENSQSGPDCSPYGTFGQHSTQTKLAFEHADRGLDATAKPLQLPEPRSSLMPLFRQLQRFRCGIEGSISMLKRKFGLGRVLAKGSVGTAIWTGLAIFAYNVWQRT